MEIEIISNKNSEDAQPEIIKIIDYLASNDKVTFKSQQRGEEDLNKEEKIKIALEIFNKSKMNFISRFGQYLTESQLQYFQQFEAENGEGYEIMLLLKPIMEQSKNKRIARKNRRYEALKQLIQANSYFSEVEMMKRNPLLYEQLVGQYLSLEEKKLRDKFNSESTTFVSLLLEGMERDRADDKKKIQQENEECAMEEEEDSDGDDDIPVASSFMNPKPSTSKWGEFPEIAEENPIRRYAAYTTPQKFITLEERELLHNEFVTLMYRNFLDGNDEEFDYESVDNNESFDNIDIINHDKEDQYFDEEEPENVDGQQIVESSEDELDIYMNALNQHPTVCQLSQDLKRL